MLSLSKHAAGFFSSLLGPALHCQPGRSRARTGGWWVTARSC